MNSSSSRPSRGLSYFLAASSSIALDWEAVSDEHKDRVLELLQTHFGRPPMLPQNLAELMALFNARPFLKNVAGCEAELLLRSIPALPVKQAALFLYRENPVAVIVNPREPESVGLMCTDDNWQGVNAEELRQLCDENEQAGAASGSTSENVVTGRTAEPATPRITRSASLKRSTTPRQTPRASLAPGTAPTLTREGSSSGTKRKRAEVEPATPQPRRVRSGTTTTRFYREVVLPLQQLRRREDPVVFFSRRGFKMEPLKSLVPKPALTERISHFIQAIRK